MKKNILLFLVSTTVTLIFCELLIRIIMPQVNEHDIMFQYDHELGWEFVPDESGRIVYKGGINHIIQTNKDGFRDAPFDQKTGETKIMVLGDSFVSNIAVENQEEVFTQVMEKQTPNSSVYNLGVNGYGQIQEYLVLKKWFPKIQPDLIVAMVYLRNDFNDNVNKESWVYSRPSLTFDANEEMKILPPSEKKEKRKMWSLYIKLHLPRFVKNSIANIKAKTFKKLNTRHTPPEVYTCRNPLSEDGKIMYKTMERLLIEINNYGEKINTPVLFALAPSMVQVEDALWSQVEQYDTSIHLEREAPNKRLLSFAKANDLEMIDLMPALQKEDQRGVFMYNRYEHHWTPEGNKVVANVLSNYIKGKMIVKDSL